MSRSGRVLGLDYGEVTIGLAISDPTRLIAQPLEPLRRVGPRKDLNRLAGLIAEHEVALIVFGLPLMMSGEEGESARTVREFADGLARRVPGLEIEMWDERLSTVQAERTLIAGDMRRRKRRKVIDTVAAVLILQNYLDAAGSSGAPPP